jgi:hypothetical protein
MQATVINPPFCRVAHVPLSDHYMLDGKGSQKVMPPDMSVKSKG